jgi:hypothetical protein
MDILRREIARINNQVSWIFWAMALTAGVPRLQIVRIDDKMSRIFFAMRLRTKLRA